MPYKEINDLRKQGFLEEATRMAENEYASSPGRIEATALFWCLNDRLKLSGYSAEAKDMADTLDRMRSLMAKHDPDNQVTGKALEVADNMMSCDSIEREGWMLYQALRVNDTANTDDKWEMLNRYIQIHSSHPSLLGSLMMAEAVKLEKSEPRGEAFLDFVRQWDLDNLRPEDWEQRDGKKEHRLSSLAEKIIGAYMLALTNCGECPEDKFRDLLNKAIARFPSNLHLYRHSAQLHALDGDTEAAIDIILRLLARSPEKHYLWDDMAKFVEDEDLRIGMLCNAVVTSKTDEVSLNIRLRLAECLCKKGFYANTLSELNKYRDIMEHRGWSPKRRFFDVLHLVPYGTYPETNALLYAEFKALANAYVFRNVPSKLYVKVWEQRNRGGNRAEASWLMRHDEEEIWIKPRKYSLDHKSHNGSVFIIYTSPYHPGQIISIDKTELREPLPWLKIIRAPITIKSPEPGNVYGFVEGAYVPASMLYGLADGAIVSAIAIRNGSNRWQTLFLYKQ